MPPGVHQATVRGGAETVRDPAAAVVAGASATSGKWEAPSSLAASRPHAPVTPHASCHAKWGMACACQWAVTGTLLPPQPCRQHAKPSCPRAMHASPCARACGSGVPRPPSEATVRPWSLPHCHGTSEAVCSMLEWDGAGLAGQTMFNVCVKVCVLIPSQECLCCLHSRCFLFIYFFNYFLNDPFFNSAGCYSHCVFF